MRCCDKEMCKFTFESNSLGNIFAELKNDPTGSEFLINTAVYAYNSSMAQNLTEPFPRFLLKK